MTERVPISTDDLAVHFAVQLAVIGQRSPWVIRDLVNPKIGPRDMAKIETARRQLAALLAENMRLSKWTVTRPPIEIQHGR